VPLLPPEDEVLPLEDELLDDELDELEDDELLVLLVMFPELEPLVEIPPEELELPELLLDEEPPFEPL